MFVGCLGKDLKISILHFVSALLAVRSYGRKFFFVQSAASSMADAPMGVNADLK